MEPTWTGLEGLEVYRQAREFRRAMYRLARTLPADERFNLTSQIRRAAVSLTNNIAEGYGRFHYKESMHFLRTARGSLEELRDDLSVCADEQYADDQLVTDLMRRAEDIRRLLNGYIRYLGTQAAEGRMARRD